MPAAMGHPSRDGSVLAQWLAADRRSRSRLLRSERRHVSIAAGLLTAAAAAAAAWPTAFAGLRWAGGSRLGRRRSVQIARGRTALACEAFDDDPLWSQPPDSWPESLASLFVSLGPHTAADDFLAEAPFTSSTRARLYALLSNLPLNENDVSSWLYPPACHLLKGEQFRRLFEAAGVQAPLQRVLDVGSGDGCVTDQLRPLCNELVLAESSRGMARRLRRSGYTVWREDIAQTGARRAASGDGGFSVVSMLNVLDRCPAPRRLLQSAHALMQGGQSWLLLASPLPFEASWYGWRTRWSGRPLESLGLAGEDWESDGQTLLEDLLPECGFLPRAVSRVPYLLGGDELDGGRVELDDIVVLAERY